MPMLNPRGCYRVLSSASLVKTRTDREAAVLGAIVSCMVDTATFNPRLISTRTGELLEQYGFLGEPASNDEIGDIVKRFNHVYDPA
jgi:hypothetical protein